MLGESGLFDSSLDSSFNPGMGLDGKEPFQELGGGERLLYGMGQFLVKDLLYSQKLQCLQMLPDFCQGLLQHGRYPL